MSRLSETFDHEHLTVIEPPRGWRLLDWKELWAYRELLWVLAGRDIKVRYKQTALGVAWAVLRPLLTMVIFAVVFGRLAKMPSDGLPYPLFVYSGLLPWTFFATAVSSSGQSLIGSSHLVSKVYFPRLIIPFSSVGAAFPDLLISSCIMLLIMLWYGVRWPLSIATAPFLLLGLAFVAAGVGTFLAALTVAFRDFTHITPFLIQIWTYITPVIFPVSLVPERWRLLMYLNPMTGVVESFRWAFLAKRCDPVGVAISGVMALVLFGAGVGYFERVERRFADII